MRVTVATAAALCLSGVAVSTAAGADGRKKCFDKGAMKYVDCAALSPTDVDPGSRAVAFTDGAEYEGAYVALRGGYLLAQDFDFTADGGDSVDGEFGAGYTASGALGYQMLDVQPGLDLRFEVEIGYQEAEIDDVLVNGVPAASDGEASVAYGFFNVYGDFQLAPRWELFAGGGLGAGVVDFEDSGVSGLTSLGDSEAALGFHLDAGLSYQISPDVSLEAGYRYSSFLDAEVGSTGEETDFDSHQVLVGVKFKL